MGEWGSGDGRKPGVRFAWKEREMGVGYAGTEREMGVGIEEKGGGGGIVGLLGVNSC
ncbi:MAG: hypothetical protein JST42_30595 [Bacteroidetes bacterium]|nr:hypothetical protein [Bacteroidota bacterium]